MCVNVLNTQLSIHYAFGTRSEHSQGVNLKVNINLRDGYSFFMGAHYLAVVEIIGVFYTGALNGHKNTPNTLHRDPKHLISAQTGKPSGS